jgi:hypothetical protein
LNERGEPRGGCAVFDPGDSSAENPHSAELSRIGQNLHPHAETPPSSREAFATLATTTGQDCPSIAGFHSGTEAMLLFTAAIVGLKCAFHG